jgi:hypothetical protein
MKKVLVVFRGYNPFFWGYILAIILLFLYSFTQVDLSLTLSRFSYWQSLQRYFQYIGYFERPVSTLIYVLIILSLFVFYFLFLSSGFAGKRKVEIRNLIGLTAIILLFSYNAFSYDLFNYIFDAKIITFYHDNPYIHKALDYPSDPMLSFMHWTHRTYPYGPAWLVITVPLSLLGFQFFLPTFLLFKSLATASFLGTVYFLGRIARRLYPQDWTFIVTSFAFNPLVLVESLVSAHIDIVMMFFAVLSFYLLIGKRYVASSFIFILSILIKFATVFLLPIYVLVIYLQLKKKEVDYNTILHFCLLLMLASVVAQTVRTNFQPWYLLEVLPFAALLARRFYILAPLFIISLFSLLNYVPFLYLGNWNAPVPEILLWLNISGILLAVLSIGIYGIITREGFKV